MFEFRQLGALEGELNSETQLRKEKGGGAGVPDSRLWEREVSMAGQCCRGVLGVRPIPDPSPLGLPLILYVLNHRY